jgi:hypothetical protein
MTMNYPLSATEKGCVTHKGSLGGNAPSGHKYQLKYVSSGYTAILLICRIYGSHCWDNSQVGKLLQDVYMKHHLTFNGLYSAITQKTELCNFISRFQKHYRRKEKRLNESDRTNKCSSLKKYPESNTFFCEMKNTVRHISVSQVGSIRDITSERVLPP